MNKHDKIINVIKNIRESFGASISVYTLGNCYQFFEILKSIFEDAEAYYDQHHVWTKIDNKFYDIRGENPMKNIHLFKIEDKNIIKSLSVNKWSDKRRNKLKNK